MTTDVRIAIRSFVFVLLVLSHGCKAALSPLLIVPGILGSQLQAKLNKEVSPYWRCSTQSDWYTVWVSLRQISPFVIDCWLNNTSMLFKNGEYSNTDGVQIRAPGFGGTGSVEYIDTHHLLPYFYYFVEFFTKHGYVRGVSLRAAPYDWRLTPDLLEKNHYYDNVRKLIETMYNKNGNARVTIVTHSMGSLITLYFLTNVVSQQWKDKYVQAFVPLSGGWKGTVKGLVSITSGNTEGIPVIKSKTARYLQRRAPSSYFLIPVPDHNIWSSTEPVVVTPDRNYTVYDYPSLFTDMQYSVGYSQYKVIPSLLTTLSPPNVDTYCYYGTGVPTATTLVYKKKQFPNAFPSIVKGNGDGAVNDASLRACSVWKQTQSYEVNVLEFPGVTHAGIVSNYKVLQAILNIVRN